MLEVLMVMLLCAKVKTTVAARGRKPGGFIALTIILWIVFEIIGLIGLFFLLDEISTATTLFAVLGGALGGGLAYLIAANCKVGSYVPPHLVESARYASLAQPLDAPCSVTITRQKSIFGSGYNHTFYVNGAAVGTVSNGQSISFVCTARQNFVYCLAPTGLIGNCFTFEAFPGGNVTIMTKSGNLLPGKSVSYLPSSALPAASTVPQFAPVQTAPPVSDGIIRCISILTAENLSSDDERRSIIESIANEQKATAGRTLAPDVQVIFHIVGESINSEEYIHSLLLRDFAAQLTYADKDAELSSRVLRGSFTALSGSNGCYFTLS